MRKLASIALIAGLAALAAAVNDVVAFSQADARWRNERLGNSNLTIGQAGCVVTSLASVWRVWENGWDPKTVNNELKRVGGFSGPNVVWAKSRYFRTLKDWSAVAADTPYLNARLDEGCLVVVQTMIGAGRRDPHWVLVYKREGVRYRIMDPLYGDKTFFADRYGDPKRWIYKAAFYKR
ncbi:MAG: hypothetical protein KIS66_02675 [Fimbriimonadaceae bacterium]|nr:hypothetical protein [Fimbriimonadaceae bacterium]